MDGADFITRFRAAAVDEVFPFHWSDSAILTYLDEAQVQFCIRTEGIPDRLDIDIPAGEAAATLPPTVLKVRKAHLMSVGRELRMGSEEDSPLPRPGIPSAIVVDGAAGTVTLDAVQSKDDQVALSVFRLPKRTIVHPCDTTETPRQFDQTLMHYALHLAYSRTDADTFDGKRAGEHLELFVQGCFNAARSMGRRRKPNYATTFSW